MADTKQVSTLPAQVNAELDWLESQREIGKRLRDENTALIEAFEESQAMDEEQK